MFELFHEVDSCSQPNLGQAGMCSHLSAIVQHGLRGTTASIAMSIGNQEFIMQFLLLAAVPGGEYLFNRQVCAVCRAPPAGF